MTFIEIVVTITLLGMIVVPLLSSVRALTRTSSLSRSAANVESALINAVDRVNRAPVDRCDFSIFAEAAVKTMGWEPSSVAVDHAYLDAGTWISGPAGAAACPSTGDHPQLVKLVTLTITSPDGHISRSVQVVKTNV